MTEDRRCWHVWSNYIYCAYYHWNTSFVYSINKLLVIAFVCLSQTIQLTLLKVSNSSVISASRHVSIRYTLIRRTNTWPTLLGLLYRHLGSSQIPHLINTVIRLFQQLSPRELPVLHQPLSISIHAKSYPQIHILHTKDLDQDIMIYG